MKNLQDPVFHVDVLAPAVSPLWVSRKSVVGAEGYKLSRSDDNGTSWARLGCLETGGWRQMFSRVPLLASIFRARLHLCLPLEDGTALVVAGGRIIKARLPGCQVESAVIIERGSRPLDLCRTPAGRVYWGEYFLNLSRSRPVRVFGSDDGGAIWNVVHTFPRGGICHVHRVEFDQHDGSVLVCTGDRDDESGIWRTRDNFHTLELVAGGSQETRTVTLFPRRDALLYATDNPSGKNWIISMDRHSGARHRIQEIPGPSVYGCRVGGQIAFSTMVERDAHEVSLWVGDEAGFRCVLELASVKVNRLWRELAGYPTILLPEGPGGEHLFFMPRQTKLYANQLCRMEVA